MTLLKQIFYRDLLLIFSMLIRFVIFVSLFLTNCEKQLQDEFSSYSLVYSSRSIWSYDLWFYEDKINNPYPLTKNRWNDDSPIFYKNNSKLLFVSDRSGTKNIYKSNLNYHDFLNKYELTNTSLLLNDFNYAINPRVSKSGTNISFVSNNSGNYEIYIYSENDNNYSNLSMSKYKDYNQQFTPDGLSIIYQSLRGKNNNEIILKSLDGSLSINLTAMEGDDLLSPHQSISNSGKFLVFSSNRDGDYEIYRMNLDGTNLVKLTNNDINDTSPVIDPSGESISYISEKEGNYEIFLMDSWGSSTKNISNSEFKDYNPLFSSNGDYISFLSDRDGNLEIYVVSTTGNFLKNISNNDRGDFDHKFVDDFIK